VARAIALLGEQGWEMTSSGNLGDATHAIYFKRPMLDMEDTVDDSWVIGARETEED